MLEKNNSSTRPGSGNQITEMSGEEKLKISCSVIQFVPLH